MYNLLNAMMFLVAIGIGCKEKAVSNEGESSEEVMEQSNSMKLSLAEWSLHKELMAGELKNLEFGGVAGEMGFEGIEYVNQFFRDKAEDMIYLDSLNAAAEKAGVKQLLIMVDGEGNLGDTSMISRDAAVENHKKWVRAASFLKCHSIRVNAFGLGTAEEVGDAAVKGLNDLATYAEEFGINVIVENHGGYSSDGKWLSDVMKRIKKDNCGTLPDFGNFCVRREKGDMWNSPCVEEYDRYQGVKEMMPYAKAVSAKSHNFDEEGNETVIDYHKMLKIISGFGYKGFVGVEYEGSELSEREGIMKTKALIEKVLSEI